MASSSVLIVCLKNFTHHTKYLKIFYFKTKKGIQSHGTFFFFFHLNNVKVRGGRISISYIIIVFFLKKKIFQSDNNNNKKSGVVVINEINSFVIKINK